MAVATSPFGGVQPQRRADIVPRTLIVSHRLPLTARVNGSDIDLQDSDGGLATGLRSVHEAEDGLWIGWAGLTDCASLSLRRRASYRLADIGALQIVLTEEEVAGYYLGYASSLLWPVLHECLHHRAVRAGDWEHYCAVNQRYADVVAEQLRDGDQVWVHDFHLMLLPRLLKERCPNVRIGFFLHTPFPPADAFGSIDQAAELLNGMLHADLIGFHTREYCLHFASAVQAILGVSLNGHASNREHLPELVTAPIGIDVPFFTSWVRKPEVRKQAIQLRSCGKGPLLVGVDRLDYTKGIPERLQAFERLLELEPGFRGRVRLIQIAVPSRSHASGYAQTRRAVERLVERINQRFGSESWTPVEYQYSRVDTGTLVALYRAADVMLVTPLCDGMNLVAKEFVACRDDEDGVLLLSSRAGAAAELHAALLTDPRQPDDLVDAYLTALDMKPAERRARMRYLRQAVERSDVFSWAKRFLGTLNGADYREGETDRKVESGEGGGLRLLP